MIHPIKNVLWATDFSAESKEALAYAISSPRPSRPS